MADSFRLGTGGDTLCQVQRRGVDPAAPGLFDRSYAIVCRDATSPIGRLYAIRSDRGAGLARLAAARTGVSACRDEAPVVLAGAGSVAVSRCQAAEGVPYDVLRMTRGGTLFVAEGLSGYRSALELGLRTLIADRPVDGPITIATTGAGDPASFARAQAGSLDPALALSEGYRRNNSGSYAEASEFFDTLLQRSTTAAEKTADRAQLGEYLVNRALQQSDLGNYDAADALFAEAAAALPADPVAQRQQRNYAALDLLNRQQPAAALRRLDQPIAAAEPIVAPGTIDRDVARAMNEAVPLATQLGIGRESGLTPAEKIVALDAQASALRGAILRQQGRAGDAAHVLAAAATAIDRLRDGRLASVARLRAQVMTEQAALAEGAGRTAEAERLLRAAQVAVGSEYPSSLALNAADARLAAFLSRRGKVDEAMALYRAVVADIGAKGGAGGFADLLDPYFALLVRQLADKPALAADVFSAAQVILRPGVADTQATLARELSAGSGEAGRLFRASLNQARQTNIVRLELERLLTLAQPTAQDRAAIAADRAQLTEIEAEQTATQAQLARFPAYRAIATQSLGLAELRAVLRPGEAYWKLTTVGKSLYGVLVTPDGAQAWRVPLGPAELARRVDALRATIALAQNGATVTPPFDAAAARALYLALAGPAAKAIPGVHHLIFEPDGAMLRLPVTLLIDEQAGLDRYLARQKLADADPYDMTGIGWLGGHVEVSVALSPRAFRDVRATAPSRAGGTYLGFGQNSPVAPFVQLTGFTPSSSTIDCRWPLASWSHPVAAAELDSARRAAGVRSLVVTGDGFTDSDILGRDDLAKYRILHFATHGLVVAPRPQCPAQPALLTSFGGKGSDGLLSFGEIYGLHLDADLVILSACDTAGTADVAATRAAGLTRGGGNALDGLVRAFIGAGGRSVLASHWPAPDSFGATRQLIEGLFTAPPGTAIAEALRRSQVRLQAVPATSHPYYWAGFALIGDGARPVLRPQ